MRVEGFVFDGFQVLLGLQALPGLQGLWGGSVCGCRVLRALGFTGFIRCKGLQGLSGCVGSVRFVALIVYTL